MIKGKKIFITGGAGFIGSTLVGKLVENNQITVLDNLERDSLKNKGFAGHSNLNLIVGNILDTSKIEAALAYDTDIVIHCAAIAGIDPVLKNPVKTMLVNMIGSANMLEAASRLSHCQRVICFSTSEIFGQHALNVNEDEKTAIGRVGEARWTYAASKLAQDHLAMAYYQEQKLPVTVLRPFNIYGPGQVGASAMRNFIVNALRNEPIEIHGDGTQVRAWCYVDDMVDATMTAMEHPQAVGELFNIGNQGTTTTIFELANMIVSVLNSRSPVVFTQKNYIDVEQRIPDTDKARRLLGFEAQVELAQGILRTAEFYELSSNTVRNES
jgi:UDP-glucose 4-epimerase